MIINDTNYYSRTKTIKTSEKANIDVIRRRENHEVSFCEIILRELPEFMIKKLKIK